MELKVCRIVAKIIDTGVVVKGEFVFTPTAIMERLERLNALHAEEYIHWSECIIPVMS